MRILHVVEHLRAGGGVLSPWHLAAAAHTGEVEEHEFLSLGSVNHALMQSAPHLKVHQRRKRSFEELSEWILDAGFDVLHWHWWERMPFLEHMSVHRGPRVVVTCDVYPSHPEFRLTKREIDYADIIVFDGRDAMDVYDDIPPAKKRWIVGSGKLDDYLSQHTRREHPAIRIGRGSVLSRYKCPVSLITDVLPVLEAIPDAEFLIFGEGPLRRRLTRDIRKNGLQSRVALCGWVDDFPAKVKDLDIYLYYLPHDSFASSELNLQGAAAAGLPIVLVPSRGTGWMFQHGVNALVADTPAEAASYVGRLARDPEERRRLGDAARAKAMNEWGIPPMVEQYRTQVYEPLAAIGRRIGDPRGRGATPLAIRMLVAWSRAARFSRRARRKFGDLTA